MKELEFIIIVLLILVLCLVGIIIALRHDAKQTNELLQDSTNASNKHMDQIAAFAKTFEPLADVYPEAADMLYDDAYLPVYEALFKFCLKYSKTYRQFYIENWGENFVKNVEGWQ